MVVVEVVDDHVAADLPPVEAVGGDFKRADGFERDDVEDEDVERVLADKREQTLQGALASRDCF